MNIIAESTTGHKLIYSAYIQLGEVVLHILQFLAFPAFILHSFVLFKMWMSRFYFINIIWKLMLLYSVYISIFYCFFFCVLAYTIVLFCVFPKFNTSCFAFLTCLTASHAL